MKRLFNWLKSLFFPPSGSTPVRRILPYAILIVLLLAVFLGSMVVWEDTNQTVFCGTACHTMPPEYVTHQASAHASITCEDCHLGRAPIFTEIVRKAEYSWQTGTATITNSYTYPIFAKNMRPANDACIPCHNPSLFSGDKVVTIPEYASDKTNTLTNIFMILKTGGGTSRQGLGYGIHWHIENPVYYYATDATSQDIPYVRVQLPDGRIMEYVDTESTIDTKSIQDSQLRQMDCITCHNRAAHAIDDPDEAVNSLMSRALVSPEIPEIKKQAVAVLTATYTNQQDANTAIDGLAKFYQDNYSDYVSANQPKIQAAIDALKNYYDSAVFFDQKYDWTTHPNNIGHEDSAGCFRCHDGKHLSLNTGETIRLECNLCHSIPVVASAAQAVTNIQVSNSGIEPASHQNSNWINLHRMAFDTTCSGCHTVADPGGTSNTSFCSNSECHGAPLKFANLDAPNLKSLIQDQIPTPAPTPTAAPTPIAAPTTVGGGQAAGGKLTWADVSASFQKCTGCHASSSGAKGLDLSSYGGVMAGSSSGPVIVPGDPANSKLYQVQSSSHPVLMTSAELAKIVQWIKDGALEK